MNGRIAETDIEWTGIGDRAEREAPVQCRLTGSSFPWKELPAMQKLIQGIHHECEDL